MTEANANHIRIEYETLGNPSYPPILLIIGLGGQLIYWDEEFCRQLADSGHFVIRFDNRDAGLSTRFEEAGVPDIMEIIRSRLMGETVVPPYTIEDMADDAAGLLQALGIEKAHICGMSMGGMIAQTLAIRHPRHVRSLISIYSHTGNPSLPPPKPEIMGLLLTPPPGARRENIEHNARLFRALTGPGAPFDPEWVRKTMALAYDRAFYPQGVARQLIAILTQNNRKAALKSISAPTLVIHGTADPLVPFEGGKETAEAVPGAEMTIIEGMGHDLPHGEFWSRIGRAIITHMMKAEASAP